MRCCIARAPCCHAGKAGAGHWQCVGPRRTGATAAAEDSCRMRPGRSGVLRAPRVQAGAPGANTLSAARRVGGGLAVVATRHGGSDPERQVAAAGVLARPGPMERMISAGGESRLESRSYGSFTPVRAFRCAIFRPVRRICPGTATKKGLITEAFHGIWLPGPARWNSVSTKYDGGPERSVKGDRGAPADLSGVFVLAPQQEKASSLRPFAEFGSPGPLGGTRFRRSTMAVPSGQLRVIEALPSTRPACLRRHPHKKDLDVEALFINLAPRARSVGPPIDAVRWRSRAVSPG